MDKYPHDVVQDINGIKVCVLKDTHTLFCQSLPPALVYESKNILFLGECGSGKTTAINSLCNFLLGVEHDHTCRIKLIHGETVRVGGTKTVVVYWVLAKRQGYAGTLFRIIDTPGFGDPEGLTTDQEIVDLVYKFIDQSQFDLHAICFVMKGSNTKVSAIQKYVAEHVLSIFGKDVLGNMVALLTFCDAKEPEAESAVKKIPIDSFFKLNCGSIYPSKNDGISKRVTKALWDMTYLNFEGFVQRVASCLPVSLHNTKKVLNGKKQIELNVTSLRTKIDRAITKKHELVEQLEIFIKNADKIKNNEDFTYTVTETTYVEVHTSHPTTNCTKCPLKDSLCHSNCGISDMNKSGCSAMDSSGNCRTCPKKCHYSAHINARTHVEPRQRTKTRTSKEVLAEYKIGKDCVNKADALITKLTSELHQLTKDVAAMLDECKQLLDLLDAIALRPFTGDTLDYVNQLILNEENEKEDGWERRVKTLFMN